MKARQAVTGKPEKFKTQICTDSSDPIVQTPEKRKGE